jgi:hypothetical protein
VVGNGKVLTMDHRQVAEAVVDIQARVVADIPNRDRKARRAEEVAPRVYESHPVFD